MLRLRTLGGLSIENGAAIGGAAANRRPLALLALLAVNGSRGLSRDTIVALLWPESDAERGRNSLSQLLSVLRRELAVDDLLLGTSELRINPDVLSCDVIEFEQSIAAHDLEAAMRLYTGPFLDGVFLKNAPEFERWVDQERARLQHAQGDALEQVAARATAAGNHVSAVHVWRQRAMLEPTDSRAARALMESLVASGDPAGALAHYRAHQALLSDDLGLEPDATLAEFATAVQHGKIRSAEAPFDARRSVAEAIPLAEQPTRAPATASPVRRRRRVLLPLAAAVLVVGIAATWGAKSGRLGSGPPAPPTRDSLRLRIVTASVQSDPQNLTLALKVRETALAELARDPWLFVVTPGAFEKQGPFIGLDEVQLAKPDTARKYAKKMRTHAIVDFSLSSGAKGYVITAEARSASTDSSLGVIAEAAAGAVDLPAAMTRLGVELRKRLVAARSTLPPTKWSLNTTDEPADALELYVEARSEADRRNYIESARRAEAAVGVDSTFAQAWRILYGSLYNAGLKVDRQLNAISAAFRFSYRVRAPYWRLELVSTYYRAIGDHEGAFVFYDSIARYTTRNNNSALSHRALRHYDLATTDLRHYVDLAHGRSITEASPGLVWSLLDQGKLAEAKHEVAEMVHLGPVDQRTFQGRAFIFAARREWDSLGVLGQSQLGGALAATDSQPGLRWVAQSAIGRGQFAAYDSMVALTGNLVKKYGSSGDILAVRLSRARLSATLAGDTARARAIADSGLAVASFESLTPMDRPYVAMLLYLASVGDVKRGVDVARDWSRSTPTEFKRRDSLNVLVGLGELALASGNAHDALRLFRIADVRDCQTCFYPRYARAFDAMSERDSARVWFEKNAAAFVPASAFVPAIALDDAAELAHTYLRLGELYEERHDAGAAVKWYDRFTTLWATTDTPVLQARVREVRGRVDRLRKQVRLN